ncbi:peroxisomal targeting signal 1 receptor, partial [Haematococcus lacustris]
VEDAFGGGAQSSLAAGRAGAKGEYVFTANNPFAGDEQALTKGKDLFRRGVLTEAALALEAEVQAHPKNAEAWRLLGTVHAENDDDQQ